MNKSEQREIDKLTRYRRAGIGPDHVALILSALIRSARTNKSAAELRAIAEQWGITNSPDFIV